MKGWLLASVRLPGELTGSGGKYPTGAAEGRRSDSPRDVGPRFREQRIRRACRPGGSRPRRKHAIWATNGNEREASGHRYSCRCLPKVHATPCRCKQDKIHVLPGQGVKAAAGPLTMERSSECRGPGGSPAGREVGAARDGLLGPQFG